MKRLFFTILIGMIGISIALAWTGSNMEVKLSYPAYNERLEITAPITFRGNVNNEDQGVDYYVIEYWHDANGNWEADSGDGSSWKELERAEMSVYNENNISSYEKGTREIFQVGEYYLTRVCAVNLNGDTSADTTVNYITDSGDGDTWENEYISAFKIKSGMTPPRPGR